MRVGSPLLPGWITDKDGVPIMEEKPVFDRDDFYQAPLGGTREQGSHKGYGFALMAEVLSTVLAGALPTMLVPGSGSKNHFAAYNIEAFTDLDQFKDTMDQMLKTLRTAQPVPGQDRVLYPGLSEAEEIRGAPGPRHPAPQGGAPVVRRVHARDGPRAAGDHALTDTPPGGARAGVGYRHVRRTGGPHGSTHRQDRARLARPASRSRAGTARAQGAARRPAHRRLRRLDRARVPRPGRDRRGSPRRSCSSTRMHDALIKPLPGNDMAPCLAESWTESPDGLVYEFKLREGAQVPQRRSLHRGGREVQLPPLQGRLGQAARTSG